jgi:hypothetical protein
VITSYWALEKLGPLYRFPTKIYISNQRGEEADVHLEGSLDPYLGQEAMYFIISELHKAGVHRIRDLSFDEYFKVLWEVREYDYGVPQNRGFIPSADRVQNTLREVFDDGKINMENYSNVRRKAFQIRKIQMVEHPSVMARNVIFRSRVDFQTLSSASHTVPTNDSFLSSTHKDMLTDIAELLWALCVKLTTEFESQLASEKLHSSP